MPCCAVSVESSAKEEQRTWSDTLATRNQGYLPWRVTTRRNSRTCSSLMYCCTELTRYKIRESNELIEELDLSCVGDTIGAVLSQEQLLNYVENQPLNERRPSVALLSKL